MFNNQYETTRFYLNNNEVKKIGNSYFKDKNKLGKRKSELVKTVNEHRIIIGKSGSEKSVMNYSEFVQ